ncbi:hypothetical protein [Janibacter sp. G56]|uniref:hypothetical protein n=1 Tax=Janibacter sp. G56 TaxID=3418717 RepID=UPI003D0890B8
MTFTDLPTNWPSRSLRDTTLCADVVDLVVRESERAQGCISLLLCDPDGRMIQPVTITDVDHDCTKGERLAVFDAFVDHLGAAFGSLVVAIGKPTGRPDAADLAWQHAAAQVCGRGGVTLLGTFVATGEGVRLIEPEAHSAVA